METEKTENENDPGPIENLFERAEAFGRTSLELYRLKAIEKLATVTSDIVSTLAIAVCVIIFFLMLNIGLALWIGELLGHSYLGFLIIAGVYALICLIVYLMKDKLIKLPISKNIIEKSLD
jgi:hypothetical protein